MKTLFNTSSRNNFFRAPFLVCVLVVVISPNLKAQEDLVIPNAALSSEAPSVRFEHKGLEDGMLQSSANTIHHAQDETISRLKGGNEAFSDQGAPPPTCSVDVGGSLDPVGRNHGGHASRPSVARLPYHHRGSKKSEK